MNNIFEFQQVSKSYGENEAKIHALKNVNVSMEEGKLTVILGPSGAGKSTMLNVLGGLDRIDDGKIIVNQMDITAYSDAQLTKYRASEIGFVFQFYNLIANLTVWENIALMKEVQANITSVETVLKQVGLYEHRHKFPAQLSGGEQQRVAIARALVKNPSLLLCDEPTGALDSKTGVLILQQLSDMARKYGKSVVIVTHNAAIAQIADQVIHMKNGEIEQSMLQKHPQSIDEVIW